MLWRQLVDGKLFGVFLTKPFQLRLVENESTVLFLVHTKDTQLTAVFLLLYRVRKCRESSPLGRYREPLDRYREPMENMEVSSAIRLVFCRETGFLQFLAGNSVFLCRKPCNGA
jgi:hypothetical protein